MREIIAGLFMTLDGVTESPEKWSFPYFNDEVGQVIGSSMESSDTILLGRRTYEEFAEYWPDKTAADDPFADYINDTPKLVVSTTLKTLEWRNSSLIQGDVMEEIAKLKRQPGKKISMTGSVTLVGSLLSAGLLDELSLLVSPIVLGSGKRLFGNGGSPVGLKVIDSKTLTNGVLSLVYGPADAWLARSSVAATSLT
jgi:dihydrofolate reductase